MTIKNYIDAGLQHFGILSEGLADLIYFLALVAIIGIITWKI